MVRTALPLPPPAIVAEADQRDSLVATRTAAFCDVILKAMGGQGMPRLKYDPRKLPRVGTIVEAERKVG